VRTGVGLRGRGISGRAAGHQEVAGARGRAPAAGDHCSCFTLTSADPSQLFKASIILEDPEAESVSEFHTQTRQMSRGSVAITASIDWRGGLYTCLLRKSRGFDPRTVKHLCVFMHKMYVFTKNILCLYAVPSFRSTSFARFGTRWRCIISSEDDV
jgi:hypothetical protein